MELGNFLGKLKGETKEEPKKFLALVLTDEVVQAAVWYVLDGKTEIVATGTPVEWDGDTGTTSELITAVDATISSATEGLDDEPSSVILGIPHSWTDKDGVLGVKREFISKIRKELELQAVGYVVITDSVLSYLKMQEGTPATSILIQVSRDELTLALVRLGRIEAIDTIGRSDDIVDDVTEGVARFKAADNLPSRIILFNSMHNLEEIIQNLLSVDWQAQFNFLHTPKIEALPKDIAIRALVVAGGSEVAKSLGFTLAQNPLPTPIEEVEEVEAVEENVENVEPVPAGSDLGGSAQPADTEAGRSDPKGEELLTAADFGFSSSLVAEKPKFVDDEDEPPTITPKQEDWNTGEPEDQTTQKKTPFVMPSIALPKFKLPTVKLPKFHLNFAKVKSHWWIIGGSVVTLAALIFYLIWFLPKAFITIRLTPKDLDQTVDITLSTKETSISFDDRIVPAAVESVEASGDKTIDTTGTKIIGDPSSGQVTIFNRTSAVKTFNKGTVLSSGTLKFTLSDDVTVASKSAGSDYVDVPGKSTVAIKASAIGAESNLAAGTEFTIASFGKDSYVAKNDEALSGGTSQEVKVASKDDQAGLTKALTDDLLAQLAAKAKDNNDSGSATYLIPDSAKADNVKYSLKVGETGGSITLSMTLTAKILRYQTADVTTLVNSQIDHAVPSGYVRSSLPSTVDLTASDVSADGSTVKGNAAVKVALLPVVDNAMLKSLIKGKSPALIESKLMSAIPGYQNTVIQFTPKWYPTRFKNVPINPNNITINLTPTI